MRRLGVLRPQPRPLLHAEAVLLVYNDETEIGELHAVFNKSMSTNQYIYLARCEFGENFVTLFGAGRTRQNPYPDAHALSHAFDGGEMLARKNLGRSHHARLKAVIDRQQHRQQRDHGLSAADIALQQAVHLAARHGILPYLLDDPFLCARQRERQFRSVERVELVAHAVEHESVAIADAHRPFGLYVELYTEKFVEFQPVLRLTQTFGRLREMNIVQRFRERYQSVFPPQRVGHVVGDTLAHDAPQTANYVVDTLRADSRRQSLRHRIDALQSALLAARQSLLDEFRFGMHHRQFAAEERRTTENHILATDLEPLLHPLYALEPNQFGRPRAVAHVYREAAFAPLARETLARNFRAEAHVGGGGVFVDFGEFVDSRAVDIAEREMVEHVAHCRDAQFALKQAGAGFADPRNELYAAVQRISHNAKIIIIIIKSVHPEFIAIFVKT